MISKTAARPADGSEPPGLASTAVTLQNWRGFADATLSLAGLNLPSLQTTGRDPRVVEVVLDTQRLDRVGAD